MFALFSLVAFASANVIPGISLDSKLRRKAKQQPVYDSADWNLLHGTDENEACIGNETHCEKGSKFYPWMSKNCVKTCDAFNHQDREKSNLRSDCADFIGHCGKDNEDGLWTATYCAKACEVYLEVQANKKSNEKWDIFHQFPISIMAFAFLILALYTKALFRLKMDKKD